MTAPTAAAVSMLTLCAAMHFVHLYAPLNGSPSNVLHQLSTSVVQAAYLRGTQQPSSATALPDGMTTHDVKSLVQTRRLDTSEDKVHHVYVPCWMQMSDDSKALISPCGEIELPPKGKKFDVSVGGFTVWSFTVPGGDEFYAWEKGSTEHVAVAFVVISFIFAVGWILLRIFNPQKFNELTGTLPPAEKMFTDKEEEDEIDIKRDNDATDASFIAPLNIYRAVAMFSIAHPKDVPRMFHIKLFVQAAVVACVQVLVPLEMIRVFFQSHSFHGWREIFWFTANAPSFICRFVVLGAASWSLTKTFINKIKDGSDANIFILTKHYVDPEANADTPPADENGQAPSDGSGQAPPSSDGQRANANTQGADCANGETAASEASTNDTGIAQAVADATGNGGATSEYAAIPTSDVTVENEAHNAPAAATCGPSPEFTESALKAWRHNVKHTWCTLSIAVSLMMCSLTWCLMLLWIASYEGSISDLATYVVPVTLVLNLDSSYVSTDTALAERYKALVRRLDHKTKRKLTLTQSRSKQIQETVCEFSEQFLQLLTPLGLIFVSVSTWMVDGKVVSSMPFP